MFRDFKFLRRGSAKNEEIENVPQNPRDLPPPPYGGSTESAARAPLNAIQEPKHEHEAGGYKSRVDRTPTKHKVGNKFGWGSELPGATPRSMRNLVKGSSSSMYSESNSAQSTPCKSVNKPLPATSVRTKGDGIGGGRGTGFNSMYRGVPMSLSQCTTVVNSEKVPHFDLKEDPSFWMDHSVQVIIRVRPLNNMEKSMNGYNRCLKQETAHNISWIGQPEARFTFDQVACETIDQETLFRMAGLPMVENCLSGYNSCMFAYGQTGSGKTYTMLGESEDLDVKPSPHRGMTPRIFEFLFARIQAEEESRRDEKLKYCCKCSFLEIYNEQITDLLEPSSTNLQLREDIMKGVYVENLSEFEVGSVTDILKLLMQGSLNRKVAATNMNRESSRSHCVFTCIIESRWEKESTTNLRFARLNLVDLAGSERQKTSGADGERLREAANINKSLSSLGHVIMVLVDVANGKPRHVPYRDSRLTFLLQDSLGGNSKTMIIANVSPSICCAAETLNTLKFAQRAKLIQNNAVVNEDSTGDVVALQNQIRLLKEENSALKRQNISRSLSFGSPASRDKLHEQADQRHSEDCTGAESKGVVRLSTKQLKSLETTLAGALRREQMAESSVKQLEAELEQLNRLVSQREEDTRRTKMMLKFREDKIQKMENLLGGLMPMEHYLVEENKRLSEENQLLQAKTDRNPEVTRFALENIRLLDQLRRYQEFYEEGERDILITEVTNTRDQLLQFLDGNSVQTDHSSTVVKPQEAASISKQADSLHFESESSLSELEVCKRRLNSSVEENAKLNREIQELHASIIQPQSATTKDLMEASPIETAKRNPIQNNRQESRTDSLPLKHAEEIMNLQLELDILKIILTEEKSARCKIEKRAKGLDEDLNLAKEKLSLKSKEFSNVDAKLKEAKAIIEVLESQQILAINEMERLKINNSCHLELLNKKELEIAALKEQLTRQEFRDQKRSENFKGEDHPLQTKLMKMHDSLEKAKRLNMWYQSYCDAEASNEEEMDEVRRQAEAETAEVIVCLQEELIGLQQQVQEGHLKELATEKKAILMETKFKELENRLSLVNEENKQLKDNHEKNKAELKDLSEEWELLTCELEEILANGHEELSDASNQLDFISSSFPQKRIWISDLVAQMIRILSEKDLIIQNLTNYLEDADNRRTEVETMLKSLKGAALAITEAHQQVCSEKESENSFLTSQLSTKNSTIAILEERMKLAEDQIEKISACATVAFVIVNRYSEINIDHLNAIKHKDTQIHEAGEQIKLLRKELTGSENLCAELQLKLSEEEKRVWDMEQKLSMQLLSLQSSMVNFEQQCAKKLEAFSHKLHLFEQIVKETVSCCYQSKELLMEEACEARAIAVQKMSEASCTFSNLEDAQKTMKEADMTIKELMINNENLKLDAERLAVVEEMVRNDRDALIIEVQDLKTINDSKSQQVENLENQIESNFFETRDLVMELEEAVTQFQNTVIEQLMPLVSDFQNTYSFYLDSSKLVRSWLENIWSEILAKDCALSAMHLCHMGVLLETVTGLNVENGLLQHGLCESNSIIADLREYNCKSRNELERCRVLKGKLLGDIKSSYDRISRNEEDTGQFGVKLSDFEKRISDLQSLEELMLQRCNSMGSQLAILMKEFDLSNSNVMDSLLEHNKLMKDKDDDLKLKEELYTIELYSNDLQSLIFSSKLEEVYYQKSVCEKQCNIHCIVLESCKKAIILSQVDVELIKRISAEKDFQIVLLEEEVEEAAKETQNLLSNLNKKQLTIEEICTRNQALEEEIQSLRSLACSNDMLKREICVANEAKMRLLNKIQELEAEYEELKVDMKQNEASTERTSVYVASLDEQNKKLQQEICLLEKSIDGLNRIIYIRDAEISNCCEFLENLKEEIILCNVDLRLKEDFLLAKEVDISLLHGKFDKVQKERQALLSQLNLSDLKIRHMAEVNQVLEQDNKLLKDVATSQVSTLEQQNQKLQQDIHTLEVSACRLQNEMEMKDIKLRSILGLEDENQKLQDQISDAESCISCLQSELLRKDGVIKGLSFDLSLLQESAANVTDQKDEIDRLRISLQDLEDELKVKTSELNGAIARCQMFETQLQEKTSTVSALELNVIKQCESVNFLRAENDELRAQADSLFEERKSMGVELSEERRENENLETEVSQLAELVDFLKNNLDKCTAERDQLNREIHNLKDNIERVKAQAKANEENATEAHELAESRKAFALEKEEEVKLLERSVEELECTVNVLENKVDLIKGEAERQRLQREDLELELDAVKHQLQTIKSSDADLKSQLDVKEKRLQEALRDMRALEMDVAEKGAEIKKLTAHIDELNLHAEAQASEYKQKFKELEAMGEQVRLDFPSTHFQNSSSNKSDKLPMRSRGSGSPFKCIGLGLAQQIKSDRDEELTAAKQRIEELESLAVSRQKEIFALNARLASAESMTHDVIRDLLGVKLDVTTYASMLDNQQVQRISKKAQINSPRSQDQEVDKLKQQLCELIEQRKGLLEEIDRRQAELVATQISLEQLCQQDQLLKTEYEMLKAENGNNKKRVIELEGEVKKLSGQQNLQQRIHHHAKIKEENNMLKIRIEELSSKLHRNELRLSRAREELARHRAFCQEVNLIA